VEVSDAWIFLQLLLVVGGLLMLDGSFSPWTHGSVVGSPAILYRNGWQLGLNQGFSAAGLIAAVVGVLAAIGGATRLARKPLPRLLKWSPILLGLVGVLIGLYGLGSAARYARSAAQSYPGLFAGGVSYGVWLVVGGGTAVVLAGILSRGTHRNQLLPWLAVLVTIAVVSACAATLAP
jgi:hypothetical protein